MGLPSVLPELALTVAFLVSITTASQNDTCYFPDGSVAAYNGLDYVPCKETSAGGVTYCCDPNDICTIAGYCVGSAGVFYRGGCTDKTWTSSLCPILCATVGTDSFTNFYPCTPGQFSHDNWTCGAGSNNCDNPTFYFDPGSLFVPQIEAVTATSTVTVTSSTTGTASALPNVGSCPTHNDTLIGVGVGLGVVLALSAIAAIAALFGFLVERRKRKAAEKIATQAQASGYDQRDLKGSSSGKMAQEAGSQTLHEIGHSHRSS